MEKEKDDVSPRGVLDAWARFSSEGNRSPKENGKGKFGGISNWVRLLKMWKQRSFKRLTSFPPRSALRNSKGKSGNEREDPLFCTFFDFKSSLVTFTFDEIEAATNNFNIENIIGRGGYSKVYKGCLKEGQVVAVKRLTKGTPEEKTSSFLSELGIIAHVKHPNTAKLIGSCAEGGMHLVFKLSPLGSLGFLLHGSKHTVISWKHRYKIALGTANGLLYLHEGCVKRIIHRDIKADNILLTKDFDPQICDFGLAKWLPKHCSHHIVSKFEGTFGYFAPEYFMHGIVDDKIDVYSFGVLLLELITGRPALDYLQQSLVIWAKPLLDNNDIEKLVDPALGDNYAPEEMERMVLTASLCIKNSSVLRPHMSQVVVLLKGDEKASHRVRECKEGSLQRTQSRELVSVQDYTSTKYLNDLNKHREVAFSSLVLKTDNVDDSHVNSY